MKRLSQESVYCITRAESVYEATVIGVSVLYNTGGECL